MNNGKWLYEHVGSEIWSTCWERFDTKEEAIEAGRKYFQELKSENNYRPDCFSVGQTDSVNLYIDPDSVVDQVAESIYDEVGEVSEGWLYRVSRDSLDDLGNKLTEVFNQWLDETGHKPGFFKVANIEDINL